MRRFYCSWRLYCSIYCLTVLFAGFLLIPQSYSAQRYELEVKQELLNISYIFLLKQIGVTEKTGNNDGEVVKYLQSVGLYKGNPYCAAGQYWVFMKAADSLGLDKSFIPIPRTGLSSSIFEFGRINGRHTNFITKKHDLLIWKKGNTIYGHTERIIETGKAGWVWTVGFNTKDAKTGMEGVFKKRRNIYHPLLNMKIRGIIGFKGV